MNHSVQPATAGTIQYPGLFRWPPFWFFIIAVLATVSIGNVTFQQYQANALRAEMQLLSSIAKMRAELVAKWKEERYGDAEIFRNGSFFPEEVELWLQKGAPHSKSRQNILDHLRVPQSVYEYRLLSLFDTRGKLVLSTSPDAALPDDHIRMAIDEAFRKQASTFLDFDMIRESHGIGMVAPLLAMHDGSRRAIGAVYLQIDPARFFIPLLNILTEHKSLEVILAHRNGNEMTLLVVTPEKEIDVRHQPYNQLQSPAYMALTGRQGIVEGVDYRGVPVYAALENIPGSGWIMEVKVDREEIQAPLRNFAQLALGAVMLLFALIGVALAVWRRSQRADFYLRQYRAAEALGASQARFRTIFEQAPLGIALIDSHSGKIYEVNAKFAEIAGRNIEEMATIDWMSITHPDDVQEDLDNMAQLNAGKIPGFRMYKRYIRPDGSFVWINMTIAPLKVGKDVSPRHLCMIEDITEDKRIESIQNARLHLMGYAPSHSMKELLVATLDEACALTGSSIGFFHFLDADQKTLTLQAWSTRTTKEFCKASGEGSHYSIDEAGVWVECIRERRPVIHNDYAALPNKRGLPPGHAHVEREMVIPIFRNELIVAILGVGNKALPYNDSDLDSITQLADLAWDIAAAKRAVEEIHRLNAELEQRVSVRTAQLEGANQELESFSYSVSHDLRVPLRAIDGFSQMLLKRYEGKLDDEGRRLLNVVRDNTAKMARLIDDILAFSRAGRLELRTSEVDMEALTRNAWSEIEASIAGRDVRLEIKSLPNVQGDPAMLRQIWVNLLGNAAKFTNTRAVANIEVGCAVQDGESIFYVKDNGAGFDQQYVHKLFGVFQRLHGVVEFEGTGIGLAIVKRIVTRHGGRVWAEGRVNEGATFYFALPQKAGQ